MQREYNAALRVFSVEYNVFGYDYQKKNRQYSTKNFDDGTPMIVLKSLYEHIRSLIKHVKESGIDLEE